MADHTVGPGDCFCSISRRYNFFNYQTLYNHADNAKLKANRPNPNMLVEGDVVKIPEKKKKKIRVPADKEHKFMVDRKPVKLRLVLLNMEQKALKAKASKLMVGARSTTDKPSGKGLLEMEIGPVPSGGLLRMALGNAAVVESKPAEVKKPAPDPTKPPPHPPTIYPQDFHDGFTGTGEKDLEVHWNMRMGTLEPHTEVRGCLQRLSNLGFAVPIVKTENADTESAVRFWQKMNKVAETGKIADIRDKLQSTHDRP